ncbi:hypothetical protein K7X08_017318 [Anisodus acutangulus]|uniref:4-coumarate--CoA ligase n=1 Tax=Anisodus acutangulus TaxID=402998 RepID=A0A9Q1LXG6_9SOLA|nr:hypothetical protein K7X08_017318 [Anisodus acutangulus]
MDQLKPTSINSCPLTPLTFLERAAIAYGESISIVYNSTTYTWSETFARCVRLASSISSLIKKGEVVSVLAPNIPPTLELQFAVPMAGAVLNNINTRLDAKTVSVLLQHSESKLVFVDYQLYSLVLQSISLFPSDMYPPILVLIEDENSVSFSRNLDFDELTTYEAMVVKGNSNFVWVRPENDWDPMTLNYTSGTTASPKGVVHSHRSLFIITVDSLVDWSVPSYPVYLWTLPMFHSNGWSYTWGMAVVGGTSICLRKFDANVVFRAITKYNVTHMCGAPVVLTMLANSPCAKPLKDPVQFRTAVVARPDEFWGETPCAFVSLKMELKKKPKEKQIIDFCRERLPHYMIPKTVIFMDELPKTATGKIQKFSLREIANGMGSLPASRM